MNYEASNPWRAMAVTPPFISPEDVEYFEKAMPQEIEHLHCEILPSPYMGSMATAKVICLALNPGFVEKDIDDYSRPDFFEQTELNLRHESAPPFYALDSRFEDTVAHEWWMKKVKGLVAAGIPVERLRSDIMSIQFFPYHSEVYKPLRETVPSQRYSHNLVRQAIEQGKTIVMMRSEHLWLKAVPELGETKYIKLRNVRNPVLSMNNMEPSEFEQVVDLLQ